METLCALDGKYSRYDHPKTSSEVELMETFIGSGCILTKPVPKTSSEVELMETVDRCLHQFTSLWA